MAAEKKPRAIPPLNFRALGSHDVPGHKCSEWCGKVKCMCGEPVHFERLPDPPKPTKRGKR